MKKTKNKTIFTIIMLLIIVFIFCLCFLFINNNGNYLPIFKNFINNEKQFENVTPTIDDSEKTWKEYVNEDYRIRFEVPPLLLKTKRENINGYQLFMNFEENQYSRDKGVAFGITDRSTDEEIDKIKDMIAQESNEGKPTETKIKVYGLDAVKLEYEEIGELEARTIVVANNGKYTFSISSVPDQIERIIASIILY